MANKIKPIDAIMYAIEMLWIGSRGDNYRHANLDSEYGRPGAVIKHMPDKWREGLKDLKAEDINKTRFDIYYYDNTYEAKKNISELLVKFDKELERGK